MALKSNRVVKNSLEGALDTPSNTAELDVKLTINKEYARKFNQVKEKQELKRLQAKLDNDSSESSDSEEEDEDGTELTGELDAAIKNTLENVIQPYTTLHFSFIKIKMSFQIKIRKSQYR